MVDSRHSELEHAGLLARGIAWLLDGIVLVLLAVVIAAPFFVLGPSNPTAEGIDGIGAVAGFLLSMVYYAGSEATWGQTPGKMVMGIRVVSTDGRDCTGFGAVIRNVTKIIGGSAFIPVLVAIVLILATDDDQRLGDILGDTTVVRA